MNRHKFLILRSKIAAFLLSISVGVYAADNLLMANTSLATVNADQSFFSNHNNMTQIIVSSPKTEYMWQNMSRALNTGMVLRDGEISELPVKLNSKIGNISFVQPSLGKLTVNEFFNKYPLDAMIVVQHGTIVYEQYKTMRQFDKHNWFSSGKVIASTLIALLEEQGKINVKNVVSSYLPELKGSVWDSVLVIDVLNMTTGLNSTEHDEVVVPYTDPSSGWYQWVVGLGVFPTESGKDRVSPIAVLGQMKRVKPGNSAFEYNSINTWVLELIAARVSNRPLNELFGDDIWRKIGAQADGYIGVTPDGNSMVWAFMSSSLRDMARFGLIFTPSWHEVSHQQIISPAILNKIQHGGNPAIFAKASVGKYMVDTLHESGITNSYQWDAVLPNGDFFKGGLGGQGLYISPATDTVIVWFSNGENDGQVMAHAIALDTQKEIK